MNIDTLVIDWLLAGDPSIRWQVGRDLLDWPEPTWRAEQARVAREGWGALLLSYQDRHGRWTPRLYGKKWISSTYSLLLLRDLGLPAGDARALKTCQLFLDEALMPDGGINVTASRKKSETCVTGMVLNLLSWFGLTDPRRERLVEYLVSEQMADGGWNCLRDTGAVHSSFHTTINVVAGLHECAEAGGPRTSETRPAEARAREFFLQHRLYRSHTTGAVVDPLYRRFAFPPRWHHDILRTLDYFRATGADYDERLEDPIAVVRSRQGADGRWTLQHTFPGTVWFEMEAPRSPSRWNTLRALRVLRWFEARKAASPHPAASVLSALAVGRTDLRPSENDDPIENHQEALKRYE